MGIALTGPASGRTLASCWTIGNHTEIVTRRGMRRRYKRRFPLLVTQCVTFSFGTVREYDLQIYLTISTTSGTLSFNPTITVLSHHLHPTLLASFKHSNSQ